MNSWEQFAKDLKYVIAKVCTVVLINGGFITPNEFYQPWWQSQSFDSQKINGKNSLPEEGRKQRGSGYNS